MSCLRGKKRCALGAAVGVLSIARARWPRQRRWRIEKPVWSRYSPRHLAKGHNEQTQPSPDTQHRNLGLMLDSCAGPINKSPTNTRESSETAWTWYYNHRRRHVRFSRETDDNISTAHQPSNGAVIGVMTCTGTSVYPFLFWTVQPRDRFLFSHFGPSHPLDNIKTYTFVGTADGTCAPYGRPSWCVIR